MFCFFYFFVKWTYTLNIVFLPVKWEWWSLATEVAQESDRNALRSFLSTLLGRCIFSLQVLSYCNCVVASSVRFFQLKPWAYPVHCFFQSMIHILRCQRFSVSLQGKQRRVSDKDFVCSDCQANLCDLAAYISSKIHLFITWNGWREKVLMALNVLAYHYNSDLSKSPFNCVRSPLISLVVYLSPTVWRDLRCQALCARARIAITWPWSEVWSRTMNRWIVRRYRFDHSIGAPYKGRDDVWIWLGAEGCLLDKLKLQLHPGCMMHGSHLGRRGESNESQGGGLQPHDALATGTGRDSLVDFDFWRWNVWKLKAL